MTRSRIYRSRSSRAGLVAGCGVVVALLSIAPPASGYETLGKAWANRRATFRFNPNFPDTELTGTREQQIEIVRSASQAWKNQSTANIELIYEGTTSRVGADLQNRENTVSFVDDEDPDALAATFIRFDSRGRVARFDIVFYDRTNGSKNRWNGPRDPESGTVDLLGVAVHEFGHALGLDHTPVRNATMFASVASRGFHLRTLEQDDLDGVEFLYGDGRPGADPSPALLSVDPGNGPGAGGNAVLIRGRNFTWTEDTTLRIDGIPLASSEFEVESLELIRVSSMPPHSEGAVPLAISNTLGIDALPNGYRYGPRAPTLASIVPALGPIEGGIPVTVRGSEFQSGVEILVGGEPLVDPERVDTKTVTGLLPASANDGLVDVELRQGADRDVLVDAFEYTELVLRLDSITAHPGSSGNPLAARVSTDRDLNGVSFGVVHDPSRLSIEDIVVTGTVAEGAAFASPNIDAVAGVTTFGIVMDFLDVSTSIPVGSDQVVALMRVGVEQSLTNGERIPVRLRDGVGQPPIELFLTPSGTADKLIPFTVDGEVTVVEPEFIRGDGNADGQTDVSDVIFILDGLFRGGESPLCDDAADANDDGKLDISDAVRLLTFFFSGAEMPPAPYPEKGPDPTEDDLDC